MTRQHRMAFPTARMLVLSGLWLWIAGAPTAFGQVPVVRADFPAADSEVPITQWQLLGPFPFDKRDLDAPGAERLPVGLNRDYLKDFGQDEASTDATTFPLAKTPKPGIVLHKQFCNELISTAPKTNILELSSVRQPFDYAVAYVAVVVESPQEQDIVIAVGADDNMRLWFNHELLAADPNTAPQWLKKFQHLIGARLKKGSNFLLVKVGNFTGDWQLVVNLLPHRRALEFARDNGVNPILASSVVSPGQPLVLRGDLLSPASQNQLQIADARHVMVDSGEIRLGRTLDRELEKLPGDGLYYCRISAEGETFERPFYYGDLEAGYEGLSRRVGSFDKTDEAIKIDLQAQLYRLKHLLRPKSRKVEFWDQKVAAIFAELEDGLATLAKGPDAYRHAPGTHIRGYRSTVDGQVQHYWIHVPEEALQTGKPIPIVIVLPFITTANEPFLESFYVAAFDETERYRLLGNEYGFAVLQMWGRGNYLGGTAIATTDVLEALDAVRRDYHIDSERMYLLGFCEAGREALLLAERYPGRFAAIASVAPITILPSRSSYSSRWTEYSSPIGAVQTLVDIPVLVRHDPADTDPPIQESERFVSRCKEAGVDVTFVRPEGGLHGFRQNSMAEKRSLFEFFRGKQLRSAPPKLASSPGLPVFGAGHGPIEDAFGAPILIVEGTLGTPDQHAVVQDLVQELRDEWQKAYFVECPMKRDIDVSDADVQKYNLVIVGDKETNRLIERMAERLPLRVTTSHVSLADRTYEGNRLGYEFISPNPLNPRRYVVVIGMNQWSPTKEWKLHPSRDGICDYFIFDLQGPTLRLNDAGNFDAAFWRQSTRSSTGGQRSSRE